MSDDLNAGETTERTDEADENLSPKEKKRKEKERKEREKKEQAEMKRRLKEQEKLIKEEAKKKTETPAEKRRRVRRENTTGGKTGTSFLSPKSSGVGAKKMNRCRVRLLDGMEYDFEIEVSWQISYHVRSLAYQ